MKIRQLTAEVVADYLKIDREDLDESKRRELLTFLDAAKQYVLSETGLTADEADEKDDLTVAVLILCQDMYDNRTRHLSSSVSKPSDTLESILGFYRCNLL